MFNNDSPDQQSLKINYEIGMNSQMCILNYKSAQVYYYDSYYYISFHKDTIKQMAIFHFPNSIA